MDPDASASRLARTSLILALLGWILYLLQWCFDLTLGLALAVMSGGSSALCGTVLDVLPFILWVIGIVTGHVSLARMKQMGLPDQGRAVWGLILSYLGLFFTLLLIILIIILIVTGIHAGWLQRILPFIHK